MTINKSNQLSSIDSKTFSFLVNLKYLDVSYNKIDSIKAGTFTELKNMRQLDLLDNRKIIFDRKSLSGLTALKKLFICRNPIVEFFPATTLCQSDPNCEIDMVKLGCW